MWYWKVWFDLIWFDLIRHSKSHWKQHSLWIWIIFWHCWFASNKYFSISFSFSRFRCSCSRKSHSRNAESNKMAVLKLEKTAFLSLAERRKENRVLPLSKSWLFDCNQFQPFGQSNREGVSSSLTNAKNHTFLFIHSFSSFTNNWEYGLPWAGYS